MEDADTMLEEQGKYSGAQIFHQGCTSGMLLFMGGMQHAVSLLAKAETTEQRRKILKDINEDYELYCTPKEKKDD